MNGTGSTRASRNECYLIGKRRAHERANTTTTEEEDQPQINFNNRKKGREDKRCGAGPRGWGTGTGSGVGERGGEALFTAIRKSSRREKRGIHA